MKTVLIPLADGFEEIEAVTLVDVLRRAGVKVVTAGIQKGECIGSRRVKVVPDVALEEVENEDFDAFILPGGQPGVDNLRKDQRVLAILKKMNEKKKLIGAICAAPLALRDAGLTKGLKLTSYPGLERDLQDAVYEQNRVVVNQHIITSRAPGTALEFALTLVEVLVGKEKADDLAEIMLVKK